MAGYYKRNIEKCLKLSLSSRKQHPKEITSNYSHNFRKKVINQHIDAVKEFYQA